MKNKGGRVSRLRSRKRMKERKMNERGRKRKIRTVKTLIFVMRQDKEGLERRIGKKKIDRKLDKWV